MSKQLGGIRTDKPSLRQKRSVEAGQAAALKTNPSEKRQVQVRFKLHATQVRCFSASSITWNPLSAPLAQQSLQTQDREEPLARPCHLQTAQAGLESLRLDLEKAEYRFVTSSGLEVRLSQMQQRRSPWVLLVTQVVVG